VPAVACHVVNNTVSIILAGLLGGVIGFWANLLLLGMATAVFLGVLARNPGAGAGSGGRGLEVAPGSGRLGGSQGGGDGARREGRDHRDTGVIKFGENFHQSLTDMIYEAVTQALADAGLERTRLQAAWLGATSHALRI